MSTQSSAPVLILLTVEEAAERLRIGRTSVYRLVSTGAVETITVGRLRRVPVECLDEYVARLRALTRSESRQPETARHGTQQVDTNS